jgi:hypothetical protein
LEFLITLGYQKAISISYGLIETPQFLNYKDPGCSLLKRGAKYIELTKETTTKKKGGGGGEEKKRKRKGKEKERKRKRKGENDREVRETVLLCP